MTQKTLSATGGHAQVNKPPSLIAQIRRGRRAAPASEHGGAPDSQLSTIADSGVVLAVGMSTSASTLHCTGSVLLNQLLGSVLHMRLRDRLLKEPEVLTLISRSKAAMRRDVSLDLFPKPIKTGLKSSRWRESEVMGWVEASTILSRVTNPGFDMKEFVAALMASRIPA